ncbi:hypothetical protein P5673_011395 [Acropora cervicornis]|uniref:Uncharacterized protein n=1 Tax=Acropora cervicornis TaxID=6130 RepID=A0AAD9QPF2_ACRCE|nr:hypothetical protein P5673_011395 [Acropora cervicornis]
MHACLYKSQRLLGSSAPKSSFDLQKEKSPVINNYTEAEIPWVAIDCNLFLPWQIHEKENPLHLSVRPRERNEKESPPKKKKKKKSKKKTGQAKRIASDNCNPQATSKQISISEREGTSSNQKAQGQTSQGVKRPHRKSIDKSRLLATFYDVKPAEKESELFLFVADQLKSKDSVLFRDCSALKSSGTVDVKVVRAVRVDRIIELIQPPETPFEKDFCVCFDGYKISVGGIARLLNKCTRQHSDRRILSVPFAAVKLFTNFSTHGTFLGITRKREDSNKLEDTSKDWAFLDENTFNSTTKIITANKTEDAYSLLKYITRENGFVGKRC